MKRRTFVKKSVAASIKYWCLSLGAAMTFLFVACDKGRRDIGVQGHNSEERQSGPGSVGGSGQDPRKKVDPDSRSVTKADLTDNVQLEGEIIDLLGSRQLSKENLTRLRSLLLQMADSDPEKLLEWCHRKYPQIDTMGLSEDHYEKALEVASHAATATQQDLYREIARTLAYQNPVSAVRILEDPTFGEKIGIDFRQQMLNATATTWAKQDLPAAKQWVEKLPATDAPNGVQGLMTTWMKSDPVAASGWLSAQPTGPARETGARVVIEQIKDTDPEMAEQWRKTLPQETPNN